MSQSFIANCLEINGVSFFLPIRSGHPHRKHKSQAGELVPQGSQIKHAKLIARNLHCGITNNQGSVVMLEHRSQIRWQRLPLGLEPEKLAKDNLYERNRSPR